MKAKTVGRKELPQSEKKVLVGVYVKAKNKAKAKKIIDNAVKGL